MTKKEKIKEFRNHLNKLTKEGNPKIMGTPFCILEILSGKNSKPFFGRIKKNNFKITLNQPLFPTPYFLEGNFELTNNEINYKVKPIWFGYLWIRVIPILFLIFFVVLYLNLDLINYSTNWIEISAFFVFLSFIFSIPIIITTRLKRKMERKFKKEYEISEKYRNYMSK